MALLCLRLDDVHGGTPVELLRLLDEQVWRGRKTVLGVVPFPARGCLGAEASLRELRTESRNSLANDKMRSYLDHRSSFGAEIAVHGLTHADHRLTGGSSVAELMYPTSHRLAWVLRTLREFRTEFGAATLVPPHNFVDKASEQQCLAEGFHVCRALVDGEVAELGLDPRWSDARAEAKRRRPWLVSGAGLVLFQSAAVSARTALKRRTPPEALAASVMDIVRPAGVGVVTFHWWDFLRCNGRSDLAFQEYAAEFLAACEQHGADDFPTVSQLARALD